MGPHAGLVPDRSNTFCTCRHPLALVVVVVVCLHRRVYSPCICNSMSSCRCSRHKTSLYRVPCPAQKQTTFCKQLGNIFSRGSAAANCMHASQICMIDQGYYRPHTVLFMCGQAASQGAGPKLGSVGAGSGFPNRLAVAAWSQSCQRLPLPFCLRALRDKNLAPTGTAPSVTPDSRRGHPNRLAEPLAVSPWALLAVLAHARRGLQLLATGLCGPRMGLLMSLALRLRWHWTRKSGPSGPDEGPQRSSPINVQHLTRQVSPVTSSQVIQPTAKYLLSRLLGSMRNGTQTKYCTSMTCICSSGSRGGIAIGVSRRVLRILTMQCKAGRVVRTTIYVQILKSSAHLCTRPSREPLSFFFFFQFFFFLPSGPVLRCPLSPGL